MIFKFGRKDDDFDEEEEEVELVLFQGAVNGKKANLSANARLVQAGLVPAKELVTDAMARRADTIRLDPKGERCNVILSVDGINYPGGRFPRQRGLAITQMLKLLAGLDIKVRDKPQRGGIVSEYQEKEYEIGIESSPVGGGAERLLVKIDAMDAGLDTPEELGMPEELREKIRELSSQRSGVLLACGPPRSGVTTTSFGMLRGVDAYLFSIYSIGDFGRRPMKNITPFEREEGEELDTSFQRCARMEADVVYINPIRSAEVAKTVFKWQEQITVLAEMTAPDCGGGIQRLVEWVGAPQAVAEGMRLIVSQKLVRTLCPACRQAFRPNPKLLSRVGLPKDTKVLYRRRQPDEEGDVEPCRKCGDLGFFGRAAMFEFIEFTEPIKKLVAGGASRDEIKAAAREAGMLTLQKDGLRLVAEGKTSLDELKRAFRGS